MKRAFILVLDSFGIGASSDAKLYGDEGSDTFGHIVETCAKGEGNEKKLRSGPLKCPNLFRLGLAHAALSSTGKRLPEIDYTITPEATFGYAREISFGKDTPSGHWEIAGVPVLFDWGYFQPNYPSFPSALTKPFIKQGELSGILGNKHASGTQILEEFGEEHIRTKHPIVYTSADSVFQIAAHEESFGLERLYDLCNIARELVDEYKIGRVIARPFIGTPGNFSRTGNRKDYSVPPPEPTLLNRLCNTGGNVIAIGKMFDIFAGQGITKTIKANGNMALFDATLNAAKTAHDNSLVLTNFVDFDSEYGHRRTVSGYANALEQLDARLPEFEALLKPGDLAIITADHGCDPTWKGTDHTREHIPILVFGPDVKPQFIGQRETFADIGQTLASHFQLEPTRWGSEFLSFDKS